MVLKYIKGLRLKGLEIEGPLYMRRSYTAIMTYMSGDEIGMRCSYTCKCPPCSLVQCIWFELHVFQGVDNSTDTFTVTSERNTTQSS